MSIFSIRNHDPQNYSIQFALQTGTTKGTSPKQSNPELTFQDFQNLSTTAGLDGSPLPNSIQVYDTNQDGKISKDEFKAIQADLKSGKLQPHRPPGADLNSGGSDIPAELKAYDTNGDGLFSADELKSILSDIQSGKLQPPKPPEGQASGASSGRSSLSDDALQKLLDALTRHQQAKEEEIDGSPQISSSRQLANTGYLLAGAGLETV